METSSDKLQQVAAEQQAHIKSLQEKLNQIDQLKGDQTYAEPLRQLQEEIYQQLLVLRENLAHTIDVAVQNQPQIEAQQLTAAAANNGGVASQDTLEELKKVKEENVKLKYRINILGDTIDNLEAKLPK
eukprot:403333419